MLREALQSANEAVRQETVWGAAAQRQKIQGVVIIESTISAGGCVPSGRVVRSVPALDFSALRAVLDWRFTPTLVDGKPVPVVMTGHGELHTELRRE